MLQTKVSVDEKWSLIADHTESRKRVSRMKGRLEALCAALDLAAVHVECAIQGVDDPGMEQAFRSIPSPDSLMTACAEYRREVQQSLELAAALAGLEE